jgi:hypothetical protein
MDGTALWDGTHRAELSSVSMAHANPLWQMVLIVGRVGI